MHISCCCYSVTKSYPILFATPWTIASQALLSIGFPRQESWSGLPFPSPGDLPDPEIKPTSPVLHTDFLLLGHQRSLYQLYFNKKKNIYIYIYIYICIRSFYLILIISWISACKCNHSHGPMSQICSEKSIICV